MKNVVPLLTLALACSAAFGADKAPPVAKSSPDKGTPAAKPHAADSQREVGFDELDKYVGKRVVVHTKLNTARSGVLTRHSKTELDLKLDTGAELTIPVDSIQRVTAPIAPPDPLFQAPAHKAGDSSAKKN